MACKLFHDGVLLIQKGEENPKFMQDRLPEVSHKCYKKKQWRKQFFEASRRVCCRLSLGLGFRPNCTAEEAFIQAILRDSFELGWRRIAEHIDPLPETDRDRDFSRIQRLGANEEMTNLCKGEANSVGKKKDSREGNIADVKSWFRCYEASIDHMFDHIVKISDETEETCEPSNDSSESPKSIAQTI